MRSLILLPALAFLYWAINLPPAGNPAGSRYDPDLKANTYVQKDCSNAGLCPNGGPKYLADGGHACRCDRLNRR